MDDASHDVLRQRLSAAVEPASEPDWQEVVAYAAALRGLPARGLQRIGTLARRQTLLFAIGLAALLAPPAFALGYLVLKSSAATASAVSLPPLPAGWTVVVNNSQRLKPDNNTNVETLITSWRYRPTYNGPASVIPPGGIMIDVTLSRDQSYGKRTVDLCETTASLPQFPPRTPPLTLPRTTTSTLEGQPHVKEFRVLGRYLDSYNFEIRVDIDTRRSVGPRWALAETITRGLGFPRWPMSKTC
ncbi:MAG: hypothetical protein KGL16_14585 [Acidobacteriota bacterium]|nr:hypothetical protein [Acidobacteriota bacterium]